MVDQATPARDAAEWPGAALTPARHDFVARFVIPALVVAFSSCSMCGDEIIQQEISPDGTMVAVSYVRNCGATTQYATHVSIASRRWLSNPFSDREPVAVLLGNDTGLALTWTDHRHLRIRYHTEKAFKRSDRWRSVSIEHVRAARLPSP